MTAKIKWLLLAEIQSSAVCDCTVCIPALCDTIYCFLLKFSYLGFCAVYSAPRQTGIMSAMEVTSCIPVYFIVGLSRKKKKGSLLGYYSEFQYMDPRSTNLYQSEPSLYNISVFLIIHKTKEKEITIIFHQFEVVFAQLSNGSESS